MDNDNLKELFGNFNPDLSSGSDFIARLQQRMDTIEMVRQYNAELRRRNRIAVMIAALAGFIMGVVLTLLMPLIGDWIATFRLSLPGHAFNIDLHYIAWVLLAAVSMFTALNTYEIALARLAPKDPVRLQSNRVLNQQN